MFIVERFGDEAAAVRFAVEVRNPVPSAVDAMAGKKGTEEEILDGDTALQRELFVIEVAEWALDSSPERERLDFTERDRMSSPNPDNDLLDV